MSRVHDYHVQHEIDQFNYDEMITESERLDAMINIYSDRDRVRMEQLESEKKDLDMKILDYMTDHDPFWEKICENPGLVINGNHYTHNGISNSPKSWRGMNGREFTIKTNDGRIIKTNDLWHQGKIPENYRHRLKDNAEFIK